MSEQEKADRPCGHDRCLGTWPGWIRVLRSTLVVGDEVHSADRKGEEAYGVVVEVRNTGLSVHWVLDLQKTPKYPMPEEPERMDRFNAGHVARRYREGETTTMPSGHVISRLCDVRPRFESPLLPEGTPAPRGEAK